MPWIPHPDDIVAQRAYGDIDMGDVTDETSVARFGLNTKFVLVYLKVKFTGGTGDATLSLKVDHCDRSGLFDFTEAEWLEAGTDGTIIRVDWRIPVEEYPRYVYPADQKLVLEWTNPDTPNMAWAAEIGLADATRR